MPIMQRAYQGAAGTGGMPGGMPGGMYHPSITEWT